MNIVVHANDARTVVPLPARPSALALTETLRRSDVPDPGSVTCVEFTADVSPVQAAVGYIAVSAGSHPPVRVGDRTADLHDLSVMMANVDLPKAAPAGTVRVCAEPTGNDGDVCLTGENPSAAMSAIRYADTVIVVAPADPLLCIATVVSVAALRRGRTRRFPIIIDGDVRTDLRAVLTGRKSATRSRQRTNEELAVVDATPRTERDSTLIAANAIPVDVACRVAGLQAAERPDMWQCWEPKHRNQPARVTRHAGNTARCPACHPAGLTPVHLVAVVLGVAPDEAAALLLQKSTDPQ